jgi:integrase
MNMRSGPVISSVAHLKAGRRSRGSLQTLPSGSMRVKVCAGVDPVTKKRHYIDEVIPAGPKAARDAQKARTRAAAAVVELPARGPDR